MIVMERKNKMKLILLFVVYVILSSSGLVLFKLGGVNPNISINIFNFKIMFSISSIIGIIFYGCSFLLWLYLVSKINLTLAMPLSVALVNTLVVVESCLFLKEKISLIQIIGIFVIVLGVTMVTFKANS